MSMNSRYLIVKDGKIMMFWVKACAEIYANGNQVKELIYDADSRNYVERL
jgi:hypothetical protein